MCTRALLPLLLSSVPLAAQASWYALYPSVAPPTRYNAVMACHEATSTVLMLFGQTTSGQLADCWRLDGSTWSQVAGPLPPVRTLTAMVYDSVRERLVLFGGSASGSGQQDDTWEWDGATWTNRSPAVSPPARSSHMMAFDRERGVTVLYGGSVGSTPAADLWEWDGVAWVQRTFTGGPGSRRSAMMAFDPVRREVLLHGGAAADGLQRNDTWTWNGSQWQQQFPLTPPPFRSNGAIASDWHRARIVVQGGNGNDLFAWEWDGAQWRMLLMASPSPRRNHVMAYDAPRRRIVLWGGDQMGVSALLDDTWAYETPLPADAVPFGAGCAGSNGTPTLAPAPYSLPWLGDTFTTRVDALPVGGLGAAIVSSFGTTPPIDLTPIGMTACDLLVPLDILEWAPAAGGVAGWSYAAPLSMALAGVVWGQQGFPLDLAANPFGLSASNAIEATFGVR